MPRGGVGCFWGDDWCVSQVVGNLAGFVSFVGPVGYEEQLELLWPPEASMVVQSTVPATQTDHA